MIEADIAAERAVTAVYTRQIGELDDEELKALLTRIRDNEAYHTEVFGDLLEEARPEVAEEPTAEKAIEKDELTSGFTVGSLLQ
jgi:rubrerythrin